MSSRLVTFSAVAVVALLIAVLMGVPDYLSRKVAATETCLEMRRNDQRCRFIGGPLEMQGSPVFMENFQQAFLPTRQQIEFVDAAGQTWTAPAKTLTDGATIPRYFAPMIGDRQSREYLMAAALHDAYCGVGNDHLETYKTRPWEEVHRMFYEALLVDGTSPQKAKIMFAAVYLGGPRWNDPARSLETVPEAALVQELAVCAEWIEAEDPTPEQIIEWMRAREAALKQGTAQPVNYDPQGR